LDRTHFEVIGSDRTMPKRFTTRRAVYLVILALLVAESLAEHDKALRGATNPEQAEKDVVKELIKNIPADFPRFDFGAHEEEAQLLSHYLWYHFHHRGGNGLTLFNKEYLLTADIWMANAEPRGSNTRVQDVHRDLLLGMQMDQEGYVLTHQHFSHAHDHGWPFPMWTQSDNHPDRVKGKTAGWHFQELDKVPGWVGGNLRGWNRKEYAGQRAASLWELENAKSLGVENDRWHVEATAASPAILTPKGHEIDAFNAPFMQLRWKRSGNPRNHAMPYIEWLGEQDAEFGPDRRVYLYPDKTPLSGRDYYHSIMTMYRHPKWRGKIKRIRIALAPGESDVKFEIDSFFTVYDTRHSINNPIFILASWRYFTWTGDLDFLRRNIARMRLALRYQQTTMGGLKYNRIRNTWPGHDGLAGFTKDEKGTVTVLGGHGIGNNYWDLMPFGWDDLYATSQYYAATLVMADIEEAILSHPGWDVPLGALAMEPQRLRRHARQVKAEANRLFWNDTTGRFIACVDKQGNRHDYGYTFLNLDAIWYGIASEEHSRSIMDWLTAKRIIDGDTSTGADIYHWRFGPRATTLRNLRWYGQGWYAPEGIPWGGQVQDGGAVLGFTFYDLWARLSVLGPDDCWRRLVEILAWEKDVHREGGYRKYYEAGKRGTTLQGGGTAGGIGIDHEFYESSLLPSIVVYGFLGLDAGRIDGLSIKPRLPESCPRMGMSRVLYHNVPLDIRVEKETIELSVEEQPVEPVRILLDGKWREKNSQETNSVFLLSERAKYVFNKL
jgi:hypothetical protein